MPALVKQALILAGGRGTRLGRLTDDCPKPLLAVAGQPFLRYLLRRLAESGVTEAILSIGYRADDFRQLLPEGPLDGLMIRHSVETTAAGTGGAVALARDRLRDPFLVLNGDTLFDLDVQALARLAQAGGPDHSAVGLRHVPDTARYGRVELSSDRVTSFAEKSSAGPGLINGGIYCLRVADLDLLPTGPSSLERDLLPALAKAGRLHGLPGDGYFIDIGLPETFARAQTELPAWAKTRSAASTPRG